MQDYLNLIDGHNNDGGETNPEEPPVPDVSFSYNIYPNPVYSQLNIEYYISGTAQMRYAIYNMSGQLLYATEPETKPAGIHYKTIDMSDFASGNYILHIQVNEKLIGEKIVKK